MEYTNHQSYLADSKGTPTHLPGSGIGYDLCGNPHERTISQSKTKLISKSALSPDQSQLIKPIQQNKKMSQSQKISFKVKDGNQSVSQKIEMDLPQMPEAVSTTEMANEAPTTPSQNFLVRKGENKKIDFSKSLKPKSPINTKMMTTGQTTFAKCILCKTSALATPDGPCFCDRCEGAGFKAKYHQDPNSVRMGVWSKMANGEYKFLPMKRQRNPIKNMSAYTSDMDLFYKFHLLPKSKEPTDMWKGQKKIGVRQSCWKQGYSACEAYNIGVPTGKVNNIMVVDLDFSKVKGEDGEVRLNADWGQDETIDFHQAFGLPFYDGETDEECKGYIAKWDTLTQMTANQGIHLFFKYDPEIKTSHKHAHIDIQSDKAYVVGSGSQVKDVEGQASEYKIIHNAQVKPLPPDLKEWILNNCYSASEKKARATRKDKLAKAETDPQYYNYILTDEQADQLSTDLKTADPEYFTDTPKWCCYTTAMKVIGKKEIWDKHSKEGEKYDPVRNEKFWSWSDTAGWGNMLNKIFNEAGKANPEWIDYISLCKYKPIYQHQLDYGETIDTNRLAMAFEPEDNKDYIIHSSTGTGKTYLVKDLYKRKKSKFISIVSRKSLAYEQYVNFHNWGIKDMVYYENYLDFDSGGIPANKNVCIQVDSLRLLGGKYMSKIKEYDIFLDEYSSLIEYLITSDTLKERRIEVFKTLMAIVRNCRRVIGVDADITSYTLRFIHFCGRKPTIIKNTYEMARGKPAYELFAIGDFKDKLLDAEIDGKKKFMLCCDTKTNAKAVFHTWLNLKELPLNDDDCYEYKGRQYSKYELLMGEDEDGVVVCLTSDNDGMVDLDDFDRVIFSPKIVYGLDSTMTRAVFCMYEEQTINPRGMLQQVARCRNPTELNYFFAKKKFSSPKFLDLQETQGDLLKCEDWFVWDMMIDNQTEINLFKDILRYIIYNDDCYKSNPYLHFVEMTKKRGWDIKTKSLTTSRKGLMKMKKEYKKLETGELFDTNHPIIKEKNDYIKAPDLTALTEDQRLVYTRNPDYEYYLKFKYYTFYTKEHLEGKLMEQEDFKQSKMASWRAQIILLRSLMEDCGCKDKFDLEVQRGVPANQAELTLTALLNVLRMRFRKKQFDLTNKDDCQELIYKAFKQVLGPKSVKSTRKQVDGERKQFYSLNDKWFEEYYELASFSLTDTLKRVKSFDEYDGAFGKEAEQFIYPEECQVFQEDSEEECDGI